MDAQQLIVAVAVAVAGFFVLRRIVSPKARRKGTPCENCPENEAEIRAENRPGLRPENRPGAGP
jgi:hypothetical protein